MNWFWLAVIVIGFMSFVALSEAQDLRGKFFVMDNKFEDFESRLVIIEGNLDHQESELSGLACEINDIDLDFASDGLHGLDKRVDKISKKLTELEIVQETLFDDYLKRNPKESI